MDFIIFIECFGLVRDAICLLRVRRILVNDGTSTE